MKLLTVLMLIILSLTDARGEERLVLGVIPIYSAIETAKIWSGFAAYLSDESRSTVSIKTTRQTDSFVSGILSGEYDIVFMTHEHYQLAKQRYEAAAVPFEKKLRGSIIARRDSSIGSLNDLNGKKIAFPSRNDYVSAVMMCEILEERGIKFEAVYLNSLSSVIIGVEKGFYAAGSVLSGLYENRSELKTVFSAEEYSTYVIGISKRLEPEKGKKIKTALLGAHENKGAKETMQMLGLSSFVSYENLK